MNGLFKTYFNFSAPIDLAKKLLETKDKEKNCEQMKIKNRWSKLNMKLKKCLKKK